jgi:hypothetical protein
MPGIDGFELARQTKVMRKIWIDLNRPLKQPQRFGIGVPRKLMGARHPAQIIVVSVQVLGEFALGSLDLGQLADATAARSSV